MRRINHPLIALLALMGFVWLSQYAWKRNRDTAYTPSQNQSMQALTDHYLGYQPKYDHEEVRLYHKMTRAEIDRAMRELQEAGL